MNYPEGKVGIEPSPSSEEVWQALSEHGRLLAWGFLSKKMQPVLEKAIEDFHGLPGHTIDSKKGLQELKDVGVVEKLSQQEALDRRLMTTTDEAEFKMLAKIKDDNGKNENSDHDYEGYLLKPVFLRFLATLETYEGAI